MGKRGARASIPTVQQLMELEARIADQAAELSKIAAGSQPALVRIANELQTRAREHRQALETACDRVDAIAPPLADLRSTGALLPLYASLNEAVLTYAALHALAHRAYDSQGDGNTADLAESQLLGLCGSDPGARRHRVGRRGPRVIRAGHGLPVWLPGVRPRPLPLLAARGEHRPASVARNAASSR